MASTYSPDLRLELIGTGEQQGTWGVTTNKNIGTLIEQAIAGGTSIDVSGSSIHTLTVNNGLPDEARNAILNFIGPLVSDCVVIAPSVSKQYVIKNSTTGGFGIIIQTALGISVTIPDGVIAIVVCNGTNFYSVNCIAGDGRVTGNLIIDGSLTAGSFTLSTPLPVASGGTGVNSSTGTGSVVLSNAPTLVSPNLGTPTVLVGNNITGFAAGLTCGSVATNANLTGVITSVGNATSIASQTGTGFTFVVDTSPTLITPNLGTPTALVGTNITGTATAFTSGNVTTNANLTGGVTSVGNAATVITNANLTGVITSTGNATSIASKTGTGSTFVVDTSPTLITPLLGTPTSGVMSNCTVDGTNAVGFRNIPFNSQSAAYTTVLADSGKVIYHPATDANVRTFTIDSNTNVPYIIGTAITFINMTTQVVTIAITTDTMYLSGAGTTGSRSLALYGSATAIKMTSTTWLISGTNLT